MSVIRIPFGRVDESVDEVTAPAGVLRSLTNLMEVDSGNLEGVPGADAEIVRDSSGAVLFTAETEKPVGMYRVGQSGIGVLTNHRALKRNTQYSGSQARFDDMGPHPSVARLLRTSLPANARGVIGVGRSSVVTALYYTGVTGAALETVAVYADRGTWLELLSIDDVSTIFSGMGTNDVQVSADGLTLYAHPTSGGVYTSDYTASTRSWSTAALDSSYSPSASNGMKLLAGNVVVYLQASATLRVYNPTTASQYDPLSGNPAMVAGTDNWLWDACIADTSEGTSALWIVYQAATNDWKCVVFDLSDDSQIGSAYDFATSANHTIGPRLDVDDGIYWLSASSDWEIGALEVTDAGSFTLTGASSDVPALRHIGAAGWCQSGDLSMVPVAYETGLYGEGMLLSARTISGAVSVKVEASFGRGRIMSDDDSAHWVRSQFAVSENAGAFAVPWYVGAYTASQEPSGLYLYTIGLCNIGTGQTGATQGLGSTATAGGLTLSTGGVVTAMDGHRSWPLGFVGNPPKVISASSSGSGSVDGSLQYVAVFETTDASGAVHTSPPSAVVSHTATTDSYITVTVAGHCVPTDEQQVKCRLYRTTDSGVTFYEIEYESPYAAGIECHGQEEISIDDYTLDADLISRPILYTQGATGARGGQLAYAPPPACRSIAASSNRVLLGGLEDVHQVQWSHEFFPGEPPVFSDTDALRVRFPEAVRAVAWSDQAWYVFSRERIWRVTGIGPDVSGVGSFDTATEVRTPCGVVHERCVINTVVGLVFWGSDAKCYVIRNGSVAAEPLGEPLRDTTLEVQVADGSPRCVGTCTKNGIHCVVFEHNEGSIVFDLDHGKWFSQDFLNFDVGTSTLTAIASATIDTAFGDEVYTYVGIRDFDDYPYIYTDNTQTTTDSIGGRDVCKLELQRLYPFGVDSWGRVRSVTLLWSAEDADDTVTITDDDTSDTFQPSAGDPSVFLTGGWVRSEWRLPKQKRESLRLTIEADQTGAVRFHGLILDVDKYRGNKRA